MGKFTAILLIFFAFSSVSAEVKTGIQGAVEWDTMQMKAEVSICLASAGLKLPAGRIQGESYLSEAYLELIRYGILDLQADSSSTIGDLVNRGDFSLQEIEALALKANSIPPSLSKDMQQLSSLYTIPLSGISSSLMRHNRPSRIIYTLNPVSAARFSGIVIIASESLPIHGMRSAALPIPCLFPKIWDSDMNLIYERSMVETRDSMIVRYSPPQGIFQNNPTGLSKELREVVGDRPLRIFAQGVFGINPTDLIIDRNDAMLIISSEENRRLLSEGRVAVILDESVLRYDINGK